MTITQNSSGGSGKSTNSLLLQYMKLLGRSYPSYADCLRFILIRSNKMQQYAGIYLLQNYSTCFGCLSHLSSAVNQILTAASGTSHSVRATTYRQRGLIMPRWRKVVVLTRDMTCTRTCSYSLMYS